MLASTNSGTSLGSSNRDTRCLTIIIVTWNIVRLVIECLESLEDTGVLDWAQAIVVDNASTDGTADAIRSRFPQVRLEALNENLGFSRGNNRILRNCSTKYAMLLNPDTVVHPNTIEALVDRMDKTPCAGAIGPRQVNRDGSVQFDGAVSLPTIWNVACEWLLLSYVFRGSRLFDRRRLGFWNHMDNREVPGIPGSAMLLRMSAIREVGLLDETMFIIEDMDLCRRLQDWGWTIEYLGSHTLLHYGGESLKGKGDDLKAQASFQSFWIYLRKHDGRLAASALTLFVAAWSGAVFTVTKCVGLLRPQWRSKFQRFQAYARSLLVWSLSNKWMFRHPLAAAPRRFS